MGPHHRALVVPLNTLYQVRASSDHHQGGLLGSLAPPHLVCTLVVPRLACIPAARGVPPPAQRV